MRKVFKAILLSCCVLTVAACEQEPPAKEEFIRPVRSIVIGDALVFKNISFSGRAEAATELDLAFNVSGPLIERPVKVGDELKLGQIVAKIDPVLFQAELSRARGVVAKSTAALKNHELNLSRDRTLFKKGHISKAKLDRSVANYDEAKADLNTARATVKRAQVELDYAQLEAPFDGIVVQTYVENFENVKAKQPIIRLIDSSEIEMVIDVPEDLISYAPLVKNIQVAFDIRKDVKVPAVISKIGTEASENTRTYPVTLSMQQPEEFTILPGMSGKTFSDGAIDVPELKKVEIPITAVFNESGGEQSFVWKINSDNNMISRSEVELGELTDHGVTVVSGVEKGDRIVTAGVNYLQDGQKIKLLQEGAAQ